MNSRSSMNSRRSKPSLKYGSLLLQWLKIPFLFESWSVAEEVKFSIKVVTNKEKTKLLFAEGDGYFVEVLLSFLTLPLGRIMKLLQKHCGDEAPNIGCLSTLYNSVVNLDSSHFSTEGAKQTLLNPTSSFENDYRELKLDYSDSQHELFYCEKCPKCRFWSESIYYDRSTCPFCRSTMKKKVAVKTSEANRIFELGTANFLITDDLKIRPNPLGFGQTTGILDITEMVNVELMNVTVGLSEIMNLLKASLVSPTPLSDVLLDKTRQTNSEAVDIEQETSGDQIEKAEDSKSKKMMLKVVVQKSTNKLLYTQAKEDFVEFLFTLLAIPLGGVEHLLASKTSIRSIDNLYTSVTNLIGDKYFKSSYIKYKLIIPELHHGYVSKNQILPLTEAKLPISYRDTKWFSSEKFPQGQGKYIKGSIVYHVMDDLTVKPYCFSSILCSLSEQMIPLSDVKEMEIEIGLKEALRILKASLTSNSALTNALLNQISNKQPKQETSVESEFSNPKQETSVESEFSNPKQETSVESEFSNPKQETSVESKFSNPKQETSVEPEFSNPFALVLS